ncbi:MAG: hypothetical protein DCC51_16315 [Anaerolineae bacterium]|nr:MAG: hypothetical protein DCC51_16315 [Anaerolineae bacterium]
MQDRPVLNVRPVADGDRRFVAAQHGREPDAHVLAQGHIAAHGGRTGDPGAGRDGWGNLLFRFAHLTHSAGDCSKRRLPGATHLVMLAGSADNLTANPATLHLS